MFGLDDALSGVLQIGSKVIDRLWPDPEQNAKAQLELVKLAQDGSLEEARIQMSAILMEAQSKDPWTSRARPGFLYVFYVYLLWGLPMSIIAVISPASARAMVEFMAAYLRAIPEVLWGVFITGYLGYTGVRSIFDKKQVEAMKKVAGGRG